MPTTADLSDTPKHTIKTVCAQTGILPVTLRAWERRYGLPTPASAANRPGARFIHRSIQTCKLKP